MIGFLEGKIVWRDGEYVCIQSGGMGYVVKTVEMPALDTTEASFYIYHVIREDNQSLYGFTSLLDRQIFEVFVGLTGVGPALALAALRKFSAGQLVEIVQQKDLDSLCQIPGVGRKKGERLLVDLYSKLDTKGIEISEEISENSTALQDAFDVLQQFGYSANEIRKTLKELDDSSVDASDIIVKALAALKANNS